MSEMQFCYCCRMHHPKEQMRRFTTRAGARWRCLRSIEAASKGISERDLFGQRQTAVNREASMRMADFVARIRCRRLEER